MSYVDPSGHSGISEAWDMLSEAWNSDQNLFFKPIINGIIGNNPYTKYYEGGTNGLIAHLIDPGGGNLTYTYASGWGTGITVQWKCFTFSLWAQEKGPNNGIAASAGVGVGGGGVSGSLYYSYNLNNAEGHFGVGAGYRHGSGAGISFDINLNSRQASFSGHSINPYGIATILGLDRFFESLGQAVKAIQVELETGYLVAANCAPNDIDCWIYFAKMERNRKNGLTPVEQWNENFKAAAVPLDSRAKRAVGKASAAVMGAMFAAPLALELVSNNSLVLGWTMTPSGQNFINSLPPGPPSMVNTYVDIVWSLLGAAASEFINGSTK